MPIKPSSGAVNLVTGATTGVGRYLIKRLIERGDEVRVVIRGEPKEQYSDWRRLPPGVIPYVADLTFENKEDARNLEAACDGVNRVFHLAGASYNSEFTYDQLIEVNVLGTQNLLDKCIEANKGYDSPIHFLFTSSVTVYGYRRPGEMLKETSELRPSSNYSRTKLMAEHVVESFGEAHSKLLYTILRLGTLYGPGYEEPHFFKAFELVKEQRMRYIGNGGNHLPLLHVDDAVRALLLAADNPKISANSIYNVTDGNPYTVSYLFELAAKRMGVEPPKKKINPTLAKIVRRAANVTYDEYEFLASDRTIDTTKIKKELGFTPVRKIDVDGLAMVEDFISKYEVKAQARNR